MVDKGYLLEESITTPDGVTYYSSRNIYYESILKNLVEEKKKWCQEHNIEYTYIAMKTEILNI